MTAAASHSFTAIAALMVVAGMGIPCMAALNGGLGAQLQSPVAAAFILFGLGALLAGALLLAVGLPSREMVAGTRWALWFGAPLVVFYILSITWSAPRIGLGNAVFFVLLGQIVAAALIDHFALFGALRAELSFRRVAGILVMALGVYLARKPR